MEKIVMEGDIVWAQKVLLGFNNRPVAEEIKKSSPILFAHSKIKSKEEQVHGMFIDQIRDFVNIITETKVHHALLSYLRPFYYCAC